MYLGDHAKHRPDHPALIMAGSGEQVTYGELYDRAVRCANVFRAHGLVPGDHVAIFADNHPRYFDALWGALICGLYVTPVNAHFTASEAAYIVTDCGARVLLASPRTADAAEALVPLTPGITMRLAFDGPFGSYPSYEDALAEQPAEPLAPERRGAFMFYSSGTTGRPKGIRPPLRDLPASDGDEVAAGAQVQFALDERSVYLSPAPLHHAAPLRVSECVQCLGGTVVCMERFDAEATLAAIERYRVTSAQFVPTMFVRMLKLDPAVRERYDVSSLRTVIHAAAPCPVEAKRQMIEWWGPIIGEYYAGSENIGQTSISSEEWLAHPGSVGRPVGTVLHVCSEDGEELPVGERGLVYLEGGSEFEYHGDPAKTAAVAHARQPGWRTLGDIGYVDDDGYLYLVDRKSFMVISGGVNIYPQEIEDVLALHPKVFDVAAFGVPDPDLGEVVQAVVQPVDWHDAGPELAHELLEHCRASLARYKVPRSIDFDAALPRTDDGKLRKGPLRDRYWGTSSSRILA
jgi:long-chain acyl-CoA synthetase